MLTLTSIVALLGLTYGVLAEPYNTFDGPGFPACNNVTAIHHPTTMDEVVSLVKNASAAGVPVRASGKGHMWYGMLTTLLLAATIVSIGFRHDVFRRSEHDHHRHRGSYWHQQLHCSGNQCVKLSPENENRDTHHWRLFFKMVRAVL